MVRSISREIRSLIVRRHIRVFALLRRIPLLPNHCITSRRRLVTQFIDFWSVITIMLALVAGLCTQANGAEDNSNIIESQMRLLRERMDIIVDGAQRAVSQLQLSMAVLGAIFTILAGIWTFRQIQDDKRRNNIENQSLQQIQTIVSSYITNITTINSLISSLKGAMEFQENLARKMDSRMESIDAQIRQLDKDKQDRDQLFQSQSAKLNDRAVSLFMRCGIPNRSRDMFKSVDNREELRTFSQQFDAFEQMGTIDHLVNPIAYFLRGLHRFNTMLYDEAVDDFRSSRTLATPQLSAPLAQYATWSIDERKRYLQTLVDEIYYHSGIVYYNLGEYAKAKEEFLGAFQHNMLDFRSRSYIPEVMFFDNNSNPNATEQEFKAAERDMNNLTTEERGRLDPSWASLFANLKMRMGNFYMKKLELIGSRGTIGSRATKWKSVENMEEAIKNYREAMRYDENSPFVKFSWAFACALNGKRSEWDDFTPHDFFKQIFNEMKNRVFSRTEPIVLCLHYYCMALCVKHGQIKEENWRGYLMDARRHLQLVPNRIRVFSPVSKVNLTHQDILEEMEAIEESATTG